MTKYYWDDDTEKVSLVWIGGNCVAHLHGRLIMAGCAWINPAINITGLVQNVEHGSKQLSVMSKSTWNGICDPFYFRNVPYLKKTWMHLFICNSVHCWVAQNKTRNVYSESKQGRFGFNVDVKMNISMFCSSDVALLVCFYMFSPLNTISHTSLFLYITSLLFLGRLGRNSGLALHKYYVYIGMHNTV